MMEHVGDRQGLRDPFTKSLEARRRWVSDRWWMSAAVVVAFGGCLMTVWTSGIAQVTGVLAIAVGLVLLATGLYRGPRGRA